MVESARGKMIVRAVTAAVLLAGWGRPDAVAASAAPAEPSAATIRYTADVHGGLMSAANTVTTCMKVRYGSVSCQQAQQGGQRENYLYWMTFIDADSDPATFDSSSALLDLPRGATVKYARLYWGGPLAAGLDNPDLPAGNRNASDPAEKNQVKFRPPGFAAYRTVTAADGDVFEGSLSGLPDYQASAEVTSLVAAGGRGDYWTADIQASRGDGGNAGSGWTLMVSYEHPGDRLRNVSIWDHFQEKGAQQGSVRGTLTGIRTPPVGPIHAVLGLVGYEGDAGATGDRVTITTTNGPPTEVSDRLNPRDDIMNSTISTFGRQVTTRDPAYINTLGYDSDVFDVSGAFRNNDTAMTLTISGQDDAFALGALATQIDLYERVPVQPSLRLGKSARVLGGGPARPGSVIQYTLRARNISPVPLPGAAFRDDLSGVLRGASYAGAARADRGAVGYAAPVLSWRGDLPPGGTATITFRVRVERGGPAVLRNIVVGESPRGNCRPGSRAAECRADVQVTRRPVRPRPICRTGSPAAAGWKECGRGG